MTELINIGNVKDEHYRYKMPKFVLKVTGKGNGVKTIITNMQDVAKALKIQGSYITKYIGFFGSRSSFDPETGKAIINGKMNYDDALKYLNEFIKKFILCSKCKLPETLMSVDENIVHMTCNACGFDALVSSQDKLYNFIIKNPPQPLIKKKQEENVMQKSVINDADIIWTMDVSDEAIKSRILEENLTKRIQVVSMVDIDETPDISPILLIKYYLNEHPNATNEEILYLLDKIKNDYKLKNSDMLKLIFESIFDTLEIINIIEKRYVLLTTFCKTPISQKILLDYIEDLISKNESLIVYTSVILDTLCDYKLFDDNILIEWYLKKKSKFVKDVHIMSKIKAAAKPIILEIKKKPGSTTVASNSESNEIHEDEIVE